MEWGEALSTLPFQQGAFSTPERASTLAGLPARGCKPPGSGGTHWPARPPAGYLAEVRSLELLHLGGRRGESRRAGSPGLGERASQRERVGGEAIEPPAAGMRARGRRPCKPLLLPWAAGAQPGADRGRPQAGKGCAAAPQRDSQMHRRPDAPGVEWGGSARPRTQAADWRGWSGAAGGVGGVRDGNSGRSGGLGHRVTLGKSPVASGARMQTSKTLHALPGTQVLGHPSVSTSARCVTLLTLQEGLRAWKGGDLHHLQNGLSSSQKWHNVRGLCRENI